MGMPTCVGFGRGEEWLRSRGRAARKARWRTGFSRIRGGRLIAGD
jgi:hypothetical protein